MDAAESVGRVLLSLALVLGLMWGIGRWARSRTGGKGKGRETLTVLARQQLTRNASVAIVKIADRAVILGVTDAQVSLLGDADLALVEASLPSSSLRRAPRSRPVPSVIESVPAAEGEPVVAAMPMAAPARKPLAAPAPKPMAAPAPKPATVSKPARIKGLEGSALSLATWTQAVEAVRERTVLR